MSVTKSDMFMSQMERTPRRVGIGPQTHDDQEERFKAAWQRLIDYKLIEWGCNPTVIEDDGIEPPDTDTIQRAVELAKRFRDESLPPPDNVVPDGDGGIVFERREGDVSEVLHVWDDGTQEYLRFHDSRLVERSSL